MTGQRRAQPASRDSPTARAVYPDRAPFDKIIATVGFPALPPAWREQTAPGGTILLPLDLAAHDGLIARLDVDAAGVVQGHFLSDPGYFMPMRHHTLPQAPIGADDGTARSTTLPVERVRVAADPFDAFAALRTGGFGWTEFVPDNGDPAEVWLAPRDGSWVCHSVDGRMRVLQGGPRRLWDEVEAAFERWKSLGEPAHDRLGLTVTPDGRHRVWLDDPDSAGSWELPT